MPSPDDDLLPEAVALVEGAMAAGLRLRLLGGLGVRVLCPDFPPRPHRDIDFACAGKGRRDVAAFLEKRGCQPDKAFNALNGDRQMYFIAPSGQPVDVMVDRLIMCHTLDLRPSLGNSSLTLDPADLLLSKLQIFELNAKDARDITHLLSGVPVGGQRRRRRSSTRAGSARCWPRTGAGGAPRRETWRSCPSCSPTAREMIPPQARFDPLAQAARLLDVADVGPQVNEVEAARQRRRPRALVRAARGSSALMKMFFATDIHGSEICWKKFLNAAAFYKADLVVLGGDVTGKIMVPVVAYPGYWEVSVRGERRRLETREELHETMQQLRDRGSYPTIVTRDELDALS